MWGRWCELLLGLWLLASPWVVPYGEMGTASTLLAGVATLLLAGISFYPRWHQAHLALLAVAAWLTLHGWLLTRGEGADPPGAQNEIIVGLLIATFAIVPSAAMDPPPGWAAAKADPLRRSP
jgi:hypothetical protein